MSTRSSSGCSGAESAAGGPDAGYTPRVRRPGQRSVDPELHLAPEPALLHQHGDFPGCDRRNRDTIRLRCLFYGGPRRLAKTRVVGDGPYQGMSVQNDHRAAAQSAGSAAGRNGPSQPMTEPRIAPTIKAVPFAGGYGESTANGRPCLVIVTGSRSSHICPITRRHLALNSAQLSFSLSPPSLRGRTFYQYIMQKKKLMGIISLTMQCRLSRRRRGQYGGNERPPPDRRCP